MAATQLVAANGQPEPGKSYFVDCLKAHVTVEPQSNVFTDLWWCRTTEGVLLACFSRSLRHDVQPMNESAIRVVVVDDYTDAASTLSAVLRSFGFDARPCLNANDCLAMCAQLRPQIV